MTPFEVLLYMDDETWVLDSTLDKAMGAVKLFHCFIGIVQSGNAF